MVALAGLCGLTLSATMVPGCTGPVSDQPCDYVAKFKAAVTKFRGHSPYFAIEVMDSGSSVYVRQTAPAKSGLVLHTPGVLIDKKSCRVCQADGYATVGEADGLRVLATYPAEKPLSASRPSIFGY
jgi:hypothetical protein